MTLSELFRVLDAQRPRVLLMVGGWSLDFGAAADTIAEAQLNHDKVEADHDKTLAHAVDLRVELASAQLKAADGFRMFRAENDELAAERDAAVRELEQLKTTMRLTMPRMPFDVRCADALADEVAILIIRKVIDSRSPAADALLDYRDPPQTERVDRICLAEDLLDRATELARAEVSRWCVIVLRKEDDTVEQIATWLRGFEHFEPALAAQAILDKKWKRP